MTYNGRCKSNKSITRPIYDFKTHTRKATFDVVEPKEIVIVEGILLFTVPEIRNFFDLKIFIDADEDIRRTLVSKEV
ncbi:MAG: hypothetical protein ACM3JI_03660 [Anaerolineae bacterium]